MKILVIGAGVIGSTYGWQLQKAGFEVSHFVRSSKLEKYRESGIVIHCVDMRKRGGRVVEEKYMPEFVDRFSAVDGYAYILVSVNSHQLPGLLPFLAENSGASTLVFLQNLRLGDDELIARSMDRSKYVIAYPFKAGGGSSESGEGYRVDTAIFGSPLTNTVIGEVDGSVSPRIKNLRGILKKAGMNPRAIHDIVPYVRTHYVWAACCVASYAKAGDWESFLASAAIRESYMAMREGWEICARQGIDPRGVSPNKYFYLPFFILIPLTRWIFRGKGMREMMEGHIRHSPAEMRDMYVTLLAKGKEAGVPMPVFEGYGAYIGK